MRLPTKTRDPVEIGRIDFEENNPSPTAFQHSYMMVFGYEPELGERVKVVLYNKTLLRQNAWWIHGFLFTHIGNAHNSLHVQNAGGMWSQVRSAKQFYEMYKDGEITRDE